MFFRSGGSLMKSDPAGSIKGVLGQSWVIDRIITELSAVN
jgi:hypothetical protein